MTPLGPAEGDELEAHIAQHGAAPVLLTGWSE
jgi:hypothetical protein